MAGENEIREMAEREALIRDRQLTAVERRATTIRRATPGDCAAICRMHVASIRGLCSRSYTPDQIESWTQTLSPGAYMEGMDGLEFYIACEAGDEVRGLLIFDPEKGEICALYVAPEAVGSGIGGTLLRYGEDAILARGHATLFLKSTVNAVSFYEQMGFERGEDSLHPLPGGISLPCVEMAKTLV
jgi:ribosomal protein S18 acetylase RimI-like enzyme